MKLINIFYLNLNAANLCTICGKTFQFKSQLEAHCVTHSDVKPFACAHCPSKFNRKDSLKDHLDVHSDAKFACDLCDVVLATKKTLKCHKSKYNKRCFEIELWQFFFKFQKQLQYIIRRGKKRAKYARKRSASVTLRSTY